MKPKIIQVVGASGSGKTVLVKALLAMGSTTTLKSSRRTLGSYLAIDGYPDMFVVGRYENGLQTCGCDTIKDVPEVFGIVKDAWLDGLVAVFEGLFVMNHTRGPALQRETRAVTVLSLTTPLDVCLASVMERRKAQGNADETRPKYLQQDDTRAKNYAFKMAQAGATVIKVSREDGLERLMELLNG